MYFNNTKSNNRKQIQLTNKQVNEIEKRQKLALMYKAKEKIEDYQNEIFEIIDNKGLKNDDEDKSLKTAMQLLEYVIPKKKSSEVVITTRKLEDIINDHIQDAEIIDSTTPDD